MKPIYKTAATVSAVGAMLALGGCVSVPTGPSVMAMPGKDKTYEQFRADQQQCQQYAQDAIGGQAAQTQNSAANSAAVGTAVGAVQCLPPGVYVAMNGRIWDPLKVRKNVAANRFEAV